MIQKITFIIALLMATCIMPLTAQDAGRLADSLHYKVEMQTTVGSGEHCPLWLNANRYGLSSVDCNYGYLRAALERPLSADDGRRWGLGYTADVAVATGMTSRLVVQQAFVEARWLKMVLTVGSKEQPMELKNQELSSGSQTLGINARPVPQVRLSLPDYWEVPYTKSWVAIKGHVAYGIQTDDGWQKDFTAQQQRYTEHTLLHTKAGYLRIGKKDKPVSVELGLEMACQFGGTAYNWPEQGAVIKSKHDLKSFFNAIIPGGTDTQETGTEGAYENMEGNHVGSWMGRLNLDYPKWNLGIYAEHFFEDQSSMFFLDYDGYGTGDEWNVKKDSRFFLYDPKDMMLGAELTLKDCHWLNKIVVEYLYTKYQSGPVYHDHTQNINAHISGRDNYYNHYIFTGWQHWGQVIGNPLYRSPLYNENGKIEVQNNRFVAWHIGLSGQPTDRMHYRLLATVQKGWGSYDLLYPDPRNNVSMMGEVSYQLPKGWQVKGAVAFDSGEIYGSQQGLQLTISKRGLLSK